MRTNIPERRDTASFIPTDHKRHAKERLGLHRARPDVRARDTKTGQWRAHVCFEFDSVWFIVGLERAAISQLSLTA